MAIGLAAVVLKVSADLEENHREKSIAATSDPSELVTLMVRDEQAQVSTNIKSGVATITIDMGSWRSTRERFEIAVSQITRKLFAKFPALNQIDYVGFKTFVNVRGQASKEVAARCTFTRRTANSVNWDNFSYKNISEIADQFWMHPAIEAKAD